MKISNLFKKNVLKTLLVLTAFLYSCNKGMDGINILSKLSDDELIEAIANSSDKQMIEYNQLPSPAKTVIDSDYETMLAESSYKVKDLGYEVKMMEYTPLYIEEKRDVYFTKKGRELISEGKKSGKGGKKKKKRKTPFKFVFPISYTMPDGSTISANDVRELKALIKLWYDENPDSKEKPKLVYPVDLDFGKGRVVTIDNEEEMKELKEKLRKRTSQGDSNNGPRGR